MAVGLIPVLLAGCGGGSEGATTAAARSQPPGKLRHLNLTLDGWEGPQAAGIVMAEKLGYFAEVGLDVAILSPISPVRPVRYVVDGTDDLGVSHEPQVVMAKERGAPIVIIGSLISQPTAALIWAKESNIKDIADLKGKSIAVTGLPFQESFLKSVLAQGGLTLDDVKVKSVGIGLVANLVGGQVDAIFGGSPNMEVIELESAGVEPVVNPVKDFGVPAYDELVVIARSRQVSKEPQLIRNFMSALARGTAAAVEDPEEVVSTLEKAVEANPATSPSALRGQVQATNPLLSEDAYVDPAEARRLIDWMYEEKMIQHKVPVSELLTNDYLTQQP